MKVQKTISLDQRTAEIAGSLNNLSQWVRARLLDWDEAGRPDGATIAEVDEILRRGQMRRLAVILFNSAEPGSDLQAALADHLGAKLPEGQE